MIHCLSFWTDVRGVRVDRSTQFGFISMQALVRVVFAENF